jgi:hypothetical protein
MKTSTIGTITLLVIICITTSCSLLPQVSANALEPIVQRDGVPFDGQSIPDEILDHLASHKVVLVGEIHFLREHRELIAVLLHEFHARGFRQFLFEWTQVADWLLDDYVMDGGLEPDWAPPTSIGGDMITAIRDFNRTLPVDERIFVHGIDVTLQDYGGSASFVNSLGALAKHLQNPGPISSFLLSDYDTPERQKTQIEILQNALKTSKPEFVTLWGESMYDTVIEMIEMELISISIREIRESNYDKSVRLREDAIKQMVDWRLQDHPYGTLINMGITHAQKKQLWGDDIEWLGDYLVHKSPVVDGSAIVLMVSTAYIVSLPESGIPDYDMMEISKDNDLFRMMHTTWPEQTVYLPLDDPLFISKRVVINSDGTTYPGILKQHFDAFILLPTAHRVSSSD